MSEPTKLTETTITIPTYDVAKPEKNPLFLEQRVYQGSSGKVYPFAVTEQVKDSKHDRQYRALILENQYIQITILPELGGRVYRALDKTNNYDFVYYNRVIKPAMVGLTGPWISGGIEFNWPQHHRPDTDKPVEYYSKKYANGAKSFVISDIDRMYGTKVKVEFKLDPDKAYLQLNETFSNPTDIPQTFLWWANPAVAVNNHTQSIFPPDVHAVYDHGKRDVSTFPLATGTYYKVDYSAGVNISYYRNLPVPTSYMAAKSKYDFLGNYDYGKHAGLLHVADHHVSPGKKQWTWGNGNFGQRWYQELTDNDGPYIELMVGTYTDNQPDFTWLQPHESKKSTEYFMPYKEIGAVKNATINAAINMSIKGNIATIKVYTTSDFDGAHVILTKDGKNVLNDTVSISPTSTYQNKVKVGNVDPHELTVTVISDKGEQLVSYTPEINQIEPTPDPAKAIPDPAKIKTNDELYLAAKHLEQYRHATYLPDDYYLEGLKRDPGDCRINDAYGLLLYRRGAFHQAEKYFQRAIKRQNEHNTNPADGNPHYHLGLTFFIQGKLGQAYDQFYKAIWSANTQSIAYTNLGKLAMIKQRYQDAIKFLQLAKEKNYHDETIEFLLSHALNQFGLNEQASKIIDEGLKLDENAGGLNAERWIINPTDKNRKTLLRAMNGKLNNFLSVISDLMSSGQYQSAKQIIQLYRGNNPLATYYQAVIEHKNGNDETSNKLLKEAALMSPDYVFPNRLSDINVLETVIKLNPSDGLATYYLGCLYYDRRQYEKAYQLWQKCIQENPNYSMAYRNIAIIEFNEHNNPKAARYNLEKAFELDPTNARMVSELDTLYAKLNLPLTDRLSFLKKHINLVTSRDDLSVQLATLQNDLGDYKAAYNTLMNHSFHPWEGGEGKASRQYEYSLIELAKQDIINHHFKEAVNKLNQAKTYPHCLGEGKLPIAHDNIIDYYLGISERQLGDQKAAEHWFKKATAGISEPASMMYYNDQPADALLYQGLAFEELHDINAARAKYFKLINYGKQHLFDKFKMDYFAVSLPDALLFNEDYQTRNTVHCHFLMGLGYLGLGKQDKANKHLSEAAQLDNHHQGIIRHQNFKRIGSTDNDY